MNYGAGGRKTLTLNVGNRGNITINVEKEMLAASKPGNETSTDDCRGSSSQAGTYFAFGVNPRRRGRGSTGVSGRGWGKEVLETAGVGRGKKV